jgi:hypothetical protein
VEDRYGAPGGEKEEIETAVTLSGTFTAVLVGQLEK